MAWADRRSASAGFRDVSLVEIAVALFVVALLLAGMLLQIGAQRDVANRADTLKTMQAATDALKGFAAVNGRVPCPAPAPGTGELPAGGPCSAAGFLPGPSLGVLTVDAWGRALRYAVATSYTNAQTTSAYPSDAATTANGLMLPMPFLVTNLRACGNSNYAYIISGAGSCAAPFASIGDGLAVAIWSDGADDTTPNDNLTTWPALGALVAMMMAAGR